MHTLTLKALRTAAVSLVALGACAASFAAEPVLLATATTVASSQLQRSVQAPMVSDQYPALAEAEMIGMGYFDFDTVLAQALAIPTAAGFTGMPSRAAIEEVLARTVSGMMP